MPSAPTPSTSCRVSNKHCPSACVCQIVPNTGRLPVSVRWYQTLSVCLCLSDCTKHCPSAFLSLSLPAFVCLSFFVYRPAFLCPTFCVCLPFSACVFLCLAVCVCLSVFVSVRKVVCVFWCSACPWSVCMPSHACAATHPFHPSRTTSPPPCPAPLTPTPPPSGCCASWLLCYSFHLLFFLFVF